MSHPRTAIHARQGIRISEHFRVRRDRIDGAGKLTLRNNSRLSDLDLRIIAQDTGELIRQLTLDPTRDYQAQAPEV